MKSKVVRQGPWDYIQNNTSIIEAALCRKLMSIHQINLNKFLHEDLPELEEVQAFWPKIQHLINWDDASAFMRMYKLVGIGLIDDGLDECGFTSFEFQTGWDLDHGASILMHRNNILVAGGMSEFCSYFESSLVPTIKSAQVYSLEEGDLSLLEE